MFGTHDVRLQVTEFDEKYMSLHLHEYYVLPTFFAPFYYNLHYFR